MESGLAGYGRTQSHHPLMALRVRESTRPNVGAGYYYGCLTCIYCIVGAADRKSQALCQPLHEYHHVTGLPCIDGNFWHSRRHLERYRHKTGQSLARLNVSATLLLVASRQVIGSIRVTST
jgi:hypothetical protein